LTVRDDHPAGLTASAPTTSAREAHEGDRLSTRSKWVILIVLITTFIVVAVLLAEVALRVRQSLKYGSAQTIEQYYTVDDRLNLRVPLPNLDSGRIKTNSLGFRGPEIATPKPAGTLRIAFLGASTTWCAEVSGNDKVWADIVARSVEAGLPGVSVDYVNGGVPGYTVASSLRNLERRIAPLAPDVIVIYHLTNDLSGELRRLAEHRKLIDDSKIDQPGWFSEYSLLWNLAEKNLRVLIAQSRVRSNVGRLQLEAPELLGATFRSELTELVRAAQRDAKVVAVATFSTQLRRDQSPERKLEAAASALYYMPFMTPDGLLTAYERYNDVIREVARSTGALLIEREGDIGGDPEHFADTVHFTDAGSAAMARRVSAALLDMLRSPHRRD